MILSYDILFQGLPQWLEAKFKEAVLLSSVSLTFQGGFAGTQVKLSAAATKKAELEEVTTWYPGDENREQVFRLEAPVQARRVRLTFEASSDFYGRIVVYSVDFKAAAGAAEGDSSSRTQG